MGSIQPGSLLYLTLLSLPVPCVCPAPRHQTPSMLSAKEEMARVSKRIKAGEKEVADLVARVADRKKALAKLDKELAKVKEGRWQKGWGLEAQEVGCAGAADGVVGGQAGGH